MTDLVPEEFLQRIATEYNISDRELEVLSLSLQGKSTNEIAKKLNLSKDIKRGEDLVRKRLSSIYGKFKIEGSGVKLTKLQQSLVRLYQERKRSKFQAVMNQAQSGTELYGRIEELEQIEECISYKDVNGSNSCQLLMILGVKGVGKTSLVKKVYERSKGDFKFKSWQTLRFTPNIDKLLEKVLKDLENPEEKLELPESKNEKIVLLLDFLQEHRCLLVFDQVESIFQDQQMVGSYQEAYQDYRLLFEMLGEDEHNSCCILITQESLPQISHLEKDFPQIVRSCKIENLPTEFAEEFLRKKDLLDQDRWGELIDGYQGNPLHLKIAVDFIAEYFQGSVAKFLEKKTLVFGDIQNLLTQVFNRLSPLEQKIVEIMVKEKDGYISWEKLIEELMKKLESKPELSSYNYMDIMAALQSLRRRSLLEKEVKNSENNSENVRYTLQPLVMKYVQTIEASKS